jgi:5-methylcytosine-specific restriction enzyme subunit McrC
MSKLHKIAISEHGRIARLGAGETPGEGRAALSAEQFERMQLWDERTAKERGGELLFDWRARYVKAKQYVGVIQWRDVLIEILPKVSTEPDEEGRVDNFARGNLRVMLEYAHNLKVEQRGVAQQDHDDAPLSEFLIRLFGRQLRDELFRGLPHGYREHEENRASLRGKLLLPMHLRANAARADRFYVRHEEFSADTGLNRALKAAARVLVRVASSGKTRELLGECVALLDDVSDVDVRTVRWESLVLDRKIARFGPVLTMARLLVQRQHTTGRRGEDETFALMYPMNGLYEQFMAGFLRREVLPLMNEAEERYTLIAQGAGLSDRHLFPGGEGQEATGLLKPDLMIRRGEDGPCVVLDTKWKHLTRRDERGKPNARDGIGMADLYQMVVYGHVFTSQKVLLVYPEPADKDIDERCYDSLIQLPGGSSEETVSVETLFVPMGVELRGYREPEVPMRRWLAEELARRLGEVLEGEEEGIAELPRLGGRERAEKILNVKYVSHTRPISLKMEDGSMIMGDMWSKLLRNTVDFFSEKYPSDWGTYVDEMPYSTKKGKTILYVSRDASKMRKPYKLGDGTFIETNASANTIVSFMRHMMDYFKVDMNNIELAYRVLGG